MINWLLCKRQIQNQPSHNSKTTPLATTEVVQTGIAPTVLIKQKLELIQFAIDQQQFIYAVDHLTQLQQTLPQYGIAPALQHSLNQALEQDKQAIQQFVLAQNQRHQLIDDLLRILIKIFSKPYNSLNLRWTAIRGCVMVEKMVPY